MQEERFCVVYTFMHRLTVISLIENILFPLPVKNFKGFLREQMLIAIQCHTMGTCT